MFFSIQPRCSKKFYVTVLAIFLMLIVHISLGQFIIKKHYTGSLDEKEWIETRVVDGKVVSLKIRDRKEGEMMSVYSMDYYELVQNLTVNRSSRASVQPLVPERFSRVGPVIGENPKLSFAFHGEQAEFYLPDHAVLLKVDREQDQKEPIRIMENVVEGVPFDQVQGNSAQLNIIGPSKSSIRLQPISPEVQASYDRLRSSGSIVEEQHYISLVEFLRKHQLHIEMMHMIQKGIDAHPNWLNLRYYLCQVAIADGWYGPR